MESADLGVGVVGLVGVVHASLNILDKVDTYKDFGTESRSLWLRFEAHKHRFRKWLHGVGIVNGRIQNKHHQLLDDAGLAELVGRIVVHICVLWSAGDL
jgi:hypothetical protein